MKKFLNEAKPVFVVFTLQRLVSFLVSYFSKFAIPVYGGWFPYVDRVLTVTKLPNWIWGWGGFDGVHYLRIAQNGYDFIPSQAFFPLYPLLIRLFNFLPKASGLDTSVYVDPSYFVAAIVFSNIVMFFALFAFYKFISTWFDKKIAFVSLVLLVSWPTAFYFGAIYTESIFLLLASFAFYYVIKKNYLFAGVLAALASATKVVGVCLFAVLIIEFYLDYKNKSKFSKKSIKNFFGILVAPLGLVSYMVYLWSEFGKPFYFVQAQPLFAAERSDKPIILLPQVLYRYFKIFINTPFLSHQFGIASLEVVMTLVPLVLLFVFVKKMKFSYWLFTLGVLIIPTLTGTFTSMPRYSLTAFVLFPLVVKYYPKTVKFIIPFLIIIQTILLANFIRGYWVS